MLFYRIQILHDNCLDFISFQHLSSLKNDQIFEMLFPEKVQAELIMAVRIEGPRFPFDHFRCSNQEEDYNYRTRKPSLVQMKISLYINMYNHDICKINSN